ncbi:MAG TPA: PilX N-terminal domain-containing pilus assembly protein [Nevskiaceae bacterium]
MVAALILLVVVTLLGIGAIHSTAVQQKMSGNFYDRQLAFQSAEAALQAAATSLSSASAGQQCTDSNDPCPTNPFDDSNLPAGAIKTVPSGTGPGQYTAAANTTGQPQYVVQYMGQYTDPGQQTGFNQTANSAGYGAQGLQMTSDYFRVTARSGDPTQVGARAVVTLQAYYKQQ